MYTLFKIYWVITVLSSDLAERQFQPLCVIPISLFKPQPLSHIRNTCDRTNLFFILIASCIRLQPLLLLPVVQPTWKCKRRSWRHVRFLIWEQFSPTGLRSLTPNNNVQLLLLQPKVCLQPTGKPSYQIKAIIQKLARADRTKTVDIIF